MKIILEKKKKYIYESPDKGKTIYRREFGDMDSKRELVTKQEVLDAEAKQKSIWTRMKELDAEHIVMDLEEHARWEKTKEEIKDKTHGE